jgi:hypothetical protein
MNTEIKETKPGGKDEANVTRKILLITALLSTIFGILYFVGLMGKLFVNGSIHAQSSPAISMVAACIGILWDVTLVILFVALRSRIPENRSVFADLGVAFMVLLAAVSTVNWYVQLTLIPRIVDAGNAAVLELLDIHNVNSVMYAMEHLAWSLFFGLAVIFMAMAFQGGRIETWIRRLLIAAGILSILFIPGYMTTNQFLIDLGYYAAGVLLPITTILIAIRYGNN